MSGRMRLVKWIKLMTPKKLFTQKQIDREKRRLRKIMKDFDEVWGDDLDYLDLLDEVSSKNPGGNKLP